MKTNYWDEGYSIGIEEIDSQHERLLEILNSLNEVRKEKNINELIEIFENLICYAKEHFETEENYMDKTIYSDYEFHKKEHDFFVKELEKIEKELVENNVYVGLSMAIFLKDWFVNHILKTDKFMIPYLKF